MAHEKEPKRAFSSIRGQIGRKLNKHPSKVSSDDIEKHGAMFVTRGDKYDTYHKTEDGYGKNAAGGYDDSPPNHAETGDYYSRSDTPISGKLTGKRLVHYLRKRKLTESTDTPAKRFIHDMYTRHKTNPINDREFIMPHEKGWAFFDMSHDGHDQAHIHYFRTHPRKSGVGSAALKELQGHAQRHGVKLHLGVGGHETPHRVLTKFYKKHGFKGGRSEDMTWHPSKDINENLFLDKVHKNPSIEAIKNIAKQSPHKEARWSVHHDGTIWAGDSSKFVHDDLGPNGSGHDADGVNKKMDIKEEIAAPTNSVGAGAVAGIGFGPQGEPGRKASLMPLARRRANVLNKVMKKQKWPKLTDDPNDET